MMSWRSMLATAITLTTAALLAGQLVHVRSSTNCPAAQDIAERLRSLLPDEAATGSAPDLATVDLVAPSGAAPTLRVRLVHANGAEVGDRRVPLADCGDAAATIAAVIAAWETEPLSTTPVATVATSPTASPASVTPVWRALVGVGGGVGLVGGLAGVGRIEALAGGMTSRIQGRIGF